MRAVLHQHLKDFFPSQSMLELELDDEAIEAINENRLTPLQCAVEDGRLDIILWLLNQKAIIKPFEGRSENTPLHHPVAAAIIAACYPKHRQSQLADPIVTLGVYFYTSWKNATHLRERVLFNLPESPQMPEALKLTPRQENIYSFAKDERASIDARIKMIQLADQSDPSRQGIMNLACVFQHAFVQRDNSVLKIILQACNDHEELLKTLLQMQQKECALFLIIGTGMDIYHLVLALKQEPVLLKQLITTLRNSLGILKGLVARCIMHQIPSQDLHGSITLLSQNKDELALIFEHCIKERYSLTFKVHSAHELFVEENYQLVKRMAHRLNIPIHSRIMDLDYFLPDVMWGIVLQYCDDSKQEDKDKEKDEEGRPWIDQLKMIPYFRNRLDSIQAPEEFQKQQSAQILTGQLTLLNQFITEAQNEINSKTRWSYLNKLLPLWGNLILLFSSVGVITFGILLAQTFSRKRELYQQLGNEFWSDERGNQEPCLTEAAARDGACGWSYCYPNMCYLAQAACISCAEYIDNTPFQWQGSLVGISGLFFLIAAACFVNQFINQQRPQRFNDVALSSYRKPVRSAANDLFAAFKGKLSNPFKSMNDKSKIGDILQTALDTRNTHQGKLNSLKGDSKNNGSQISIAVASFQTEEEENEGRWEDLKSGPLAKSNLFNGNRVESKRNGDNLTTPLLGSTHS